MSPDPFIRFPSVDRWGAGPTPRQEALTPRGGLGGTDNLGVAGQRTETSLAPYPLTAPALLRIFVFAIYSMPR